MIKSIIWGAVRAIKYVFYVPLMLGASIAYFIVCPRVKALIKADIDAFYRIEIHEQKVSYYTAFYRLMVDYKAFRNVFYYRLWYPAILIRWILRPECTLAIRAKQLGGGIYIQHGSSTQIDAKSIGRNFWTNQNVTIGWNGPGNPIIGDNVRIGTGAVVIGPNTIGNNVNIGANAIVTKDVPSDCTVVSPQAFIIKRNGKRVHEEL